MGRRFWTPDELSIVRQRYADMSTQALAELLEHPLSSVYRIAAKLKLKKSAEYLASPAGCRLGHGQGVATRFKKGIVPHNKGLRRPGYSQGRGRMQETQFKCGARTGIAAKNWRLIGTILKDTEGYLRIKVREGQKGEAYGFGNTKIWPLLNRHVWEQHHGLIPEGHAVVFKDRDRSNVAIENLELLSRRDLVIRNSVHRWGPEMFEVIQLRGALNRKLRSLGEKQDIGSTQPSV